MHGLMVLFTLTAWQGGTVGPDLPRVEESRPAPDVPAPAVRESRSGPPAAPPDAVLRWNEVAIGAIRAARTPPPQAARHLAIMHAAIHDAVNPVYQTHRSYYVHLRATDPAEPSAAAAIAAHRVLVELYPGQVATFDAALDETMGRLKAGRRASPEVERGVRIGQYVAEKVLASRAADGSTRRASFPGSTEIGLWRPTPPRYAAALLPQWPKVRPFAVRDCTPYRPEAPPGLTSEAYAVNFNEVKALGPRDSRARAAEQTMIALFWDDGAGTETPPGHWNRIARTVARQEGNSLPENARLFALLNFALADAGVLCWDCKYLYNFWRPVTAIRLADRDGNPDTDPQPGWTSLLETPPFPSYPSGHSTFSGAAATILESFYGTDRIAFTIGSDGLPGQMRSFAGFRAAAAEAGRSRIYGGIHYEFDNQAGLSCGRQLAEDVFRNVLRTDTVSTEGRSTRLRVKKARGE